MRWLRSRQHEDGAFPGRPFTDEGDLATTAVAWGALRLSTVAEGARLVELLTLTRTATAA